VNRRRSIVVLVLALAAGGVVTWNQFRPRPEPPKAPARVAIAPPRPAIGETAARPEPSVPEPAPRAARRALAARSEPAPSPEPSPPPTVAEAAPEVGILHIDSDVAGAQVFIDREYIGTTPVTAPDVKPGTHQLNLSAQGYDGIVNTIDVTPGSRDILIKFREVRLDVKIPVVHKHGIGSCRGVLIATPQGLRYESTEKNDRFTAAFQDLETFDIDYLEKNLKVKLRKARQYNFTDPDGNADRLFVFQREVEKARERIAKGDPPAGP
jgi:PEGA domain